MILFENRACAILYNLLRALPGDLPFLLPADVCPVVPLTFRKAERRFRLLDLDPESRGMDRRRCLEVVSERPEAWAGVIYVRPYGAEGEEADGFFSALKELRPDLLVIDDRCLCPPDCDGERLAPGADVTLFSTGRAKSVDLGFGGFAHCRDGVAYRRCAAPYSAAALAEVTRCYKEAVALGIPCEAGRESWLDLSAPGLGWSAYREAVREALPKAQEHRRRLNAVYTAALPEEIRLPERFQGWRFQILVPEPDRLVESLFAAGLFASRHYAPLGGIFGAARFPVAERLHRGIVNLFNDGAFDEARAQRAAGLVLQHLQRSSGY
jgi:hypothetical protein